MDWLLQQVSVTNPNCDTNPNHKAQFVPTCTNNAPLAAGNKCTAVDVIF